MRRRVDRRSDFRNRAEEEEEKEAEEEVSLGEDFGLVSVFRK